MNGNNKGKPSVLVVGAGAIGAFYGSVLAREGARVSVVCRSEFDVVRRGGFVIESTGFGEYTFHPEQVVRAVADYRGEADYVILAVKVLEDEDRAALIRPAMRRNTVIVLLENGIDIEPEVAQAFPENEILSALAFVGVGRTAPGRLSHQLYGNLVVGRYPSGASPAAERLAALWKAGGIECRMTENVVTARWQKAAWNAVFNPVSIMGGVLDTGQMLYGRAAEDFVRGVMNEVGAVAAALGHPLPPDLPDRYIKDTHAMPPYKTSMALDYENGRPMELEAIVGSVVRAGRRAGVPIPMLEAIYAIAKMIEHKARQA